MLPPEGFEGHVLTGHEGTFKIFDVDRREVLKTLTIPRQAQVDSAASRSELAPRPDSALAGFWCLCHRAGRLRYDRS